MNTANTSDIQRKLLKAITADLNEAIIITNTQRNIIQVNKAALKLTGYGETEMLDNFVGDFVKVFENEKQISCDEFCPVLEIDLNIEGDMINRKELRLVDKSNETKVVTFVSKRIKDGASADLGCVLIITDTSKELELERMKLDFVSMTAHVLRTPITILRGYSNTLLKDETIVKLNEQELAALNEITTASNDLATQVENLLKFAEVHEGQVHTNLLPINLEATISRVVNEYKERAATKGLPLNYIPPVEKLPFAMANVSSVKDVMAKLLDNAIQYTEQGHIDVGVVQEGNKLVTVVKDTGRGIPDENIPHVFQKFYRVKSALTMEMGRGLSLYLAKKLTDSMQGEIGVESKVGQGSTFYFKLPIAEKMQA